MLVLTGMVCTASADSKVIYMNAGEWNDDSNAKFVVHMFNNTESGWADLNLDQGEMYRAVIDTKYTKIILVRKNNSQTHNWDNKWNQSEDITLGDENCYTFTSWDSGTDGNSTFSKSTIIPNKIYAQKKGEKSGTIKFYDFDKTTGDYPGMEMISETVDGEAWYAYETTKTTVNGLFCIEGDNDKTTDISGISFSSGKSFFFYYPEGSGDRYSPVVRKTVSGTNIYATFSWTDGESNNKGVNFSDLPNGVKAYRLTVAGTSISKYDFSATLNKAKGLLLENTTGSDVTLSLPIWNNGNEDATSNDLYANNATHISQDEAGYTKYILALQDNLVGFYKVNTTLGNDMGTNTAYLKVATSGEARASYWFDGEATGINALENLTNSQMDNNAPMYNLAGQRVNKSYKGVVVVNGKKMLNK